jgi:hypothetical protein
VSFGASTCVGICPRLADRRRRFTTSTVSLREAGTHSATLKRDATRARTRSEDEVCVVVRDGERRSLQGIRVPRTAPRIAVPVPSLPLASYLSSASWVSSFFVSCDFIIVGYTLRTSGVTSGFELPCCHTVTTRRDNSSPHLSLPLSSHLPFLAPLTHSRHG